MIRPGEGFAGRLSRFRAGPFILTGTGFWTSPSGRSHRASHGKPTETTPPKAALVWLGRSPCAPCRRSRSGARDLRRPDRLLLYCVVVLHRPGGCVGVADAGPFPAAGPTLGVPGPGLLVRCHLEPLRGVQLPSP